MYCEKCDVLGLEFCQCKTTRLIAGQLITLTAGKRYLATRPINNGFMIFFPVTIECVDSDPAKIVIVIGDLDYDAANQFLTEFNNGPISLTGRVW